MVMHSAEKLPQESPKIEGEGQDIEQLVADLEKHEADKNVASLAADLEKLGDEIHDTDPENVRAAERRLALIKFVEREAKIEADYLSQGEYARKTVPTADEMIDMVIEVAAGYGGAKDDPETSKYAEEYKTDKELRSVVKHNLVEAIKAKMEDPSLGNDLEKVSKLEKALSELEK